jgi:hypothetical protein
MKPRLLDAYCGAGGATRGYQQAGFYVVGIDNAPQPHYCGDEFILGDALEWLERIAEAERYGHRYDAIHASPPCQFATHASARWRGKNTLADERLDLLTPTLELLANIKLPWVVENVVGAHKKAPTFQPALLLHGGMFGLGTHRPRLFMSNVLLMAPKMAGVRGGVGIYGDAPDGRCLNFGSGQRAAKGLAQAQEAMGMDWADWHGTKEAIPPAYTEFIGRQLIDQLESRAVVGEA